MLRSLYSGVAGMSTHQTKMDVIGNNISNVSTYGFKSTRVTFRDVYYQTTTDATAATAAKGGTNAVQVGYGSSLGSTDVNHSQSTLTTTGLSLDVAIAGDGYFQVMDGTGNIFYTKAGMLDIDADGNLVDVNGNFVLGVSANNLNLEGSSNRIRIDLPYESPAAASGEDMINNVLIRVQASGENAAGNVSFAFTQSNTLPYGQRATAAVTSTTITVTLNSNERFDTLSDLEAAVNEAITEANGGMDHVAGPFSIGLDPVDAFDAGGLTGAQIVNSNFGVETGSIGIPVAMRTAFSIKSVGDTFSYTDPMDYTITIDDVNETCTISAGNGTYEATLSKAQMATSGSVVMTGPESSDSFVLTFPSWANIQNFAGNTYTADVASVPSQPAKNLGFGSSSFALKGGTTGGEQTVADLTGINISANGIITGTHPTLGLLELGRIDLATFDNPAGLIQVGSTYFAESLNSGPARVTTAGLNGSGELAAGTLEASNVDLSQEFADMITTQRGFQACSRLITVSDTMLEELINLKR
ncbi:MAG: flagellar hook-basal body complex protein [Ruminococcus sp.]|nr:flagellar hook-basal body complex protein [Ruminococcus sp.]